MKRKREESRLLGRGLALVAAARLPGVELRQGALRNSLQHLLREDPEQLPADVQRLVHGPVVVWTYKTSVSSSRSVPRGKYAVRLCTSTSSP